MNRTANNKGFTLVEMMFTLTILSILIIVALPVYQGYRVRAMISEGKGFMPSIKTSVLDTYLSNGTWPTNNGEAGMSAKDDYNTRYVDSIEVSALESGNGAEVTITYDANEILSLGENNTLIYRVVQGAEGQFVWDCLGGSLDSFYRGGDCRE